MKIALILGFPDLIRARRVSRQWLQILSASQIMSAEFKLWDPLDEMKLSTPRTLTPNAITSAKAEHIHAFRTGSAFDMMIMAERHRTRIDECHVAYADQILAWADLTSTGSAQVVSLAKSARQVTVTSNFAHLSHIAVSKSMLCLVDTQGRCKVLVDDYRTVAAQLTISNRVRCIAVMGETLAALIVPLKSEGGSNILFTWQLSNQLEGRHPIEPPPSNSYKKIASEYKLIISRDEQFVLVCERNKKPERVCVSRCAINGFLFTSCCLELLDFTENGLLWRHPALVKPRYSYEWVNLWLYSDGHALLSVQYSSREGRLRLRRFNTDVKIEKDVSSAFFWKDIGYCWTKRGSSAQLQVIDLIHGTSQIAPMTALRVQESVEWKTKYQLQTLLSPEIVEKAMLLGDEDFVVSISEGSILVWSFNHQYLKSMSRHAHGLVKDNGYRKARTLAIEDSKRAKLKQCSTCHRSKASDSSTLRSSKKEK